MSTRTQAAVAALLVAVVIGAFYFPALSRRVERLARPGRTEEQAHREVTQPPIATPTDAKVNANLFWTSAATPDTLEPFGTDLLLSADAVQRSKQLINALIADVPATAGRTLPADASLLELYLLPDGTAVADFSDTLSTATPSGILSEQMAVDSVTRTLAANVQGVRRLKILIHGQDSETLAGHLDLTGFFPVGTATLPGTPTPPASPGGAGGKAPVGRLTPPPAPGKLAQ